MKRFLPGRPFCIRRYRRSTGIAETRSFSTTSITNRKSDEGIERDSGTREAGHGRADMGTGFASHQRDMGTGYRTGHGERDMGTGFASHQIFTGLGWQGEIGRLEVLRTRGESWIPTKFGFR